MAHGRDQPILAPMSSSPGPAYPRDREADVVLRDGSTVHVRPVRADDGPAIHAFLDAISPESIGFRFFGVPDLDWATAWSVDVDYADRFALVAESGSPLTIVAHAAYIRTDSDHAEIAFLVADSWQGYGISTILLAHLAGIAEEHGISMFTAEVLPVNHRMIEVLRESGFPVDMHSIARRDRDRASHLTVLRRPGPVRRARADRRGRRRPQLPGAPLGGGHRRLAQAGNSWRGGAPQPADHRVQRGRLCGQRAGGRRPVAPRLPLDRRDSSGGRARDHRRAG